MAEHLPTIHPDVAATLGRTPLVELRKIGAGLPARIVVKLESRNPCGSVKDRIGVSMIDDAERRGILKTGGTIVEATSGNTGIALAFVAAARGYRLILTMPERMSRERASLMLYLGAQIVLTPGALMRDAVTRATELEQSTPGAVQMHQFENVANPEVHRRTTAVEIWEDTQGAVDVLVAGVGTGGTITGVGEVLKAKKPSTRVIAVEPEEAAVLSGGEARHHGIQGLGAGFIPKILNRGILDEVLTASEHASLEMARRLAREEGIVGGISSGANVAAALEVARRPELVGKTIVTFVCDTGERYVNTPLMSGAVQSLARASRG